MGIDEQLEWLNESFGIESKLFFRSHESGLIQAVVHQKQCQASIFLQGAHLASYQSQLSTRPILFQSSEVVFAEGKPIRGGVPICFPWFGANKADSAAPSHGLARTVPWEVVRSEELGEGVSLTLQLRIAPFLATYRVTFGNCLDLHFLVTNESQNIANCEIALHTYFATGPIQEVEINGLEELPRLDQLTQVYHEPTREPIRFERETDAIYHGEPNRIVLKDRAWDRDIILTPCGSKSTVVWNPWIEKSKRLNDLGDEDYHHFCCIETANIGDNRWVCVPGDSQEIAVRIECVESRSPASD